MIRNLDDSKESNTNFIYLDDSVTQIEMMKVFNKKYLLVVTRQNPNPADLHFAVWDISNYQNPKAKYPEVNLTQLEDKMKPQTIEGPETADRTRSMKRNQD